MDRNGKNDIQIPPLDTAAMREACLHWDAIAKPLNGLGDFETLITRLAGMRADADVRIRKPCLAVMCADNGVVAEGVSQTGQDVTAKVAANIASGRSAAGIMARAAGCEIRVTDVGMICRKEPEGVIRRKAAYGTRDFAIEPAMSIGEMQAAFRAGEETAHALQEDGCDLICAGEMGIGNTTTSAACTAALLRLPAEEVTGSGAGLDQAGLARKRAVIADALQKYSLYDAPWEETVSSVGGFDLCALAGMMNMASALRMPVILDGVITAAAALIAERRCPGTAQYLIASHAGREPAMHRILDALHLKPLIGGNMALGEGSGAVMLLSLLRPVLAVYHGSSSFDAICVEQYVHYDADVKQ